MILSFSSSFHLRWLGFFHLFISDTWTSFYTVIFLHKDTKCFPCMPSFFNQPCSGRQSFKLLLADFWLNNFTPDSRCGVPTFWTVLITKTQCMTYLYMDFHYFFLVDKIFLIIFKDWFLRFIPEIYKWILKYLCSFSLIPNTEIHI